MVNLIQDGLLPENSIPDNPQDRVDLAFDKALQHFGIPKILAHDDVIQYPDELSIMTYVSYYRTYHQAEGPFSKRSSGPEMPNDIGPSFEWKDVVHMIQNFHLYTPQHLPEMKEWKPLQIWQFQQLSGEIMLFNQQALDWKECYIQAWKKRPLVDWKRIQGRTFVRWVNSWLSSINLNISELSDLVQKSYILCQLLELIGRQRIEYNKKSRGHFANMENCQIAVEYLHKVGIKVDCTAASLLSGDPRPLFGLIWTIILRFQLD